MYHPSAPMMHAPAHPGMNCRQQSFSNLGFDSNQQEVPQQYLYQLPPHFMPYPYPPACHGKLSYADIPRQCSPSSSCSDSPAQSPRKTGKAPRKPRTTNIVFPRRKAGETQREAEPVVITLELLQKYFDLPLHVAAKELGICATAIKKACRKVGVMRWPFRDHRFLRPAGATAAKKEEENGKDATASMEEVAASEAETASPEAGSPDERSSDDEAAEQDVKPVVKSATEDVAGFLSLCDDESLEDLYKDVQFSADEESHACSMMWMTQA